MKCFFSFVCLFVCLFFCRGSWNMWVFFLDVRLPVPRLLVQNAFLPHLRNYTLAVLKFSCEARQIRMMITIIIIMVVIRSLSAPSQWSPRHIQQTMKETKRSYAPGIKNSHAARTNVSLTSPSLHLYTHTHIHTHTYTHTHTHTETHTHTHVHMHVCAHTYTCTHISQIYSKEARDRLKQ